MICRISAALALIVVVGSLGFGSGAQAAQEATPDAGKTTTEVTRTDVRLLLSFGPDGLRPDFTVATTVEGVCGFASIVAFGRPDAWDCISADNEIFDPCFESPLLARMSWGS